MKFIRNFSRVLVGFVFIFSGIVKGIDPLGTAYRMDDYFIAYGTEWAMPLALFLAVFLCTLEFMLGVSMLFNAWIRKTSWLLFPLMLFFLMLTLVDAIWEPVPDCGCFGDAIKLTNWETFYKNVVLLIPVSIIFSNRNKFRPPQAYLYAFTVLVLFTVGFVWFSNYNLNHLPVIDFREWKVGNNMNPEGGGEAKIYLTYKNIETGEEVEYRSPDYPWQDSVWMSEWEFLDQRVDDSEVIKAHELIIEDMNGDDQTETYINNPDYQFLVIAYDLLSTRKEAFTKINELFTAADAEAVSFIVITSSLPEDINDFRMKQNLDPHLDFCYGDDIVLKTMVRANPGMLLMKDGIVLAKWHYNDFPSYEEIKTEYMKD